MDFTATKSFFVVLVETVIQLTVQVLSKGENPDGTAEKSSSAIS